MDPKVSPVIGGSSMDLAPFGNWPVVVQQAVAWGEMDSYGHVNNIVYFRYFENARLEYFRRLAWPLENPPRGVGPILHSTQCRFRKPLTWPDRIAIGARVAKVEADRFTIEHLILSERWAGVAAEGWGVIVTFDYASGTKSTVPADLCKRIDELEQRTTA